MAIEAIALSKCKVESIKCKMAGLALSREFFAAVAHGAPCSLWGEDDTRQIKPCDRIDAEFRNPLYYSTVADLWRR